MNFYNKVYAVVKRIPRGSVATYGQIALLAGSPRASRIVGSALHKNPDQGMVPCHRVVNRFGGMAPDFAFGGEEAQKALLESEGVPCRPDGTVDLQIYGWKAE